MLSLFAEFIANDKPFMIRMEGRTYFPVFVTYPETAFGGEFETAADYRDPYLRKLIAEKGGTMIWPPIRYSYNTHNLDLPTPAPSPPTWIADGGAVQGGGARRRASAVAAASNTTGSAPTTRASTWSRGSSTASASRCCSG